MTTPDESMAAAAGLARQPVEDDDLAIGGPDRLDEAGEADVESAPDATTGRRAELPDEPGEAHVAAYTAAADELAQRLDESGTGHDDSP